MLRIACVTCLFALTLYRCYSQDTDAYDLEIFKIDRVSQTRIQLSGKETVITWETIQIDSMAQLRSMLLARGFYFDSEILQLTTLVNPSLSFDQDTTRELRIPTALPNVQLRETERIKVNLYSELKRELKLELDSFGQISTRIQKSKTASPALRRQLQTIADHLGNISQAIVASTHVIDKASLEDIQKKNRLLMICLKDHETDASKIDSTMQTLMIIERDFRVKSSTYTETLGKSNDYTIKRIRAAFAVFDKQSKRVSGIPTVYFQTELEYYMGLRPNEFLSLGDYGELPFAAVFAFWATLPNGSKTEVKITEITYPEISEDNKSGIVRINLFAK